MDLTKLTDDQLRLASKVAAEARAQGIDPDFALSIVSIENAALNPKAKSEKGAIGIMQLMPKTAKALGVDPMNVDENIRGGVAYLKQQLQAFDGNKYLATVAYNAGPDVAQKFTSSGDSKLIPNETLKYLDKMSASHNMDSPWQYTSEEKPPSLVSLTTPPPPPQTKTYGFEPYQDILAGVGGATVASIPSVAGGALRATGRAIGQGIQQGMGPTTSAAAATPELAPGIPKYGGTNWVKSLTNVDLPGAQMGKEDLDLAKSMQGAIGRSAEPGFTGGKITPGGVIVGPSVAADLDKAEAAAAAKAAPGPLRRAAGAVGSAISSPIATRALGGFGTLAGGSEAVERYKKGDPLGVGLSALGATGSAMTMFPPTAPAGAALALGAPATLALADRFRNRMAEDAANPPPAPTEADLAKAQYPAAGYYPRISKRRSPEQINGALLQALDQQMKDFSSGP